MKKLIIFASGTKDGGGSGFENLVIKQKDGILKADIVAVVSNHEEGGVKKIADKFSVPFIHFPKPWDEDSYKKIISDTGAEFVALSGWLKLVKGLNPRKTINIHPGPLPRFGGAGMYGHYVHEAVMDSFKNGEVSHSAVTMHFVTDEYDKGPIFFQKFVKIENSDNSETLAKKVNLIEHKYQPIITDMVVNGQIYWDGEDKNSLVYPDDYKIETFEE